LVFADTDTDRPVANHVPPLELWVDVVLLFKGPATSQVGVDPRADTNWPEGHALGKLVSWDQGREIDAQVSVEPYALTNWFDAQGDGYPVSWVHPTLEHVTAEPTPVTY
jgi:hypothetical protein